MTAVVEGAPAPGVDSTIALEVCPVGADRDTWLRTRRTGIGGSDVSAMLRMSPYAGPYELWMDKTDRAPLDFDEDDDGPAFWGRKLEPVVAEVFAARTGIGVRQVGTLRRIDSPHMLTNPDRLCADGSGLEIKTAGFFKNAEWDDDQIPDHAELQAHWNMAVTGLSSWWVAGFIGGQHLHIRRVERDPGFIDFLAQQATDFWDVHVIGDVAPEPGGAPGTAQWLAARYPDGDGSEAPVWPSEAAEIRAEYTAGIAAEKAGRTRADAARNRARALLGDASFLMAGDDVVATWTNNGQFDEAAFTAAHPHLAAEFSATRPVLDRVQLEAAHPDVYRAHRGRRLLIKKEKP